jgi:hypothetical protein
MISLAATAALSPFTGRTSHPSSASIRPAKSAARAGSRLHTLTERNFLTRARARSCQAPCVPAPQIVTVPASGRARYFAATAVAAPVRSIVMSPDSATASGTPLAAS